MPIENKNRSAEEDASLQVAEESRQEAMTTKSLMKEVFLGQFDIGLCYPYPEQSAEDAKIGDEYCEKVEAWCKANLDGEEISRTETIPAHVFRGLKELNLFAIKIPTKYGGLGFSQTNYMRVLSVVARYCGSTAATLSAHQSIGVPQPIKLAGTDEQKAKWLPKFAEGWISAFALTEDSAGSDPATMKTKAELSEDGTEWTINGEKLWCTNSIVADVVVVMAVSGTKTTRSGREVSEISAFIVEMDSPGIELLHRCEFLGINAIENGLIRFNNVKVPAENLVGGRGKGLALALNTLNDGRLSIPAISADGAKEMLKFSKQWAKTRSQWGRQIGKHEPGAQKLSFIASQAYAMSALNDYCGALSDSQDKDIRIEAAAAKYWNTEALWELTDVALQLRGGRGYEKASSLAKRGENEFPFERALRDSRINRIVEGTTDVMYLFVARECLDFHLSNAAPLFSSKTSIGEKLGTVVKCAGVYTPWFASIATPSFKSYSNFHPSLRPYLRKIDKYSKRLARKTFGAMVLLGPKLETRQLFMQRSVSVAVDLSVMALSASRVQTAIDRNGSADEDLATVLYLLKDMTLRVESTFRAMSDSQNTDANARKLADKLMETAELLPDVDTSHLKGQPMEEREFGKDLTSGAIVRRKREIERGFQLPSGMSDDVIDATEDHVAK